MYRQEKKEYGSLCEMKRREQRERCERDVEKIKTEGQVWEFVNRARKRRVRVNEEIKIQEWDEYFRGVLGGIDSRRELQELKGKGRMEEGEMSRDEVKRIMKNLKEGKTVGGDGIPNEVWKFDGEEIEE